MEGTAHEKIFYQSTRAGHILTLFLFYDHVFLSTYLPKYKVIAKHILSIKLLFRFLGDNSGYQL